MNMNRQEKKYIRSLHQAKTRIPTGRCLVEGVRAVGTFLDSRHILDKLYLTEKSYRQHQDFCERIKHAHGGYTVISDDAMLDISAASTPSGVLAIFCLAPTQAPLACGIVCAQLQDPGNVGTVIRSAVAFNKKTVVLVDSVDPWSPKVIQASAGTIAKSDLHILSWQMLQEKKGAVPLAALVTQGGSSPSSDDAEALLVIGNEANGLPQGWVRSCEKKITLVMPGQTESLNAGVAGSIALYMTISNKQVVI